MGDGEDCDGVLRESDLMDGTWPERGARAATAKVLITVPNLHWIHKTVVHRLLLLQHDGRYRTTISLPSNKPFENNLHHIINDFMAGGYNYWLSIDDDNPPSKNPLDCVALDKDILGFPTPIWHWEGKEGERPVYLNAYRYKPEADAYTEWRPQEGLQKVDAVGTGCFLIARRVFEDSEMRKGPFLRKLHPDGTVNKGNDLSFCERARERGFEVWAHFDYWCDQMTEISLAELSRALKGLA